MPSGVFKPYAGVSTAILIFTKTEHGGTDQVWFYDMTADGYSLDDKRNEVKENDIPDIIARSAIYQPRPTGNVQNRAFLCQKARLLKMHMIFQLISNQKIRIRSRRISLYTGNHDPASRN